jgi:hypothetical protein
VVLGASAVELGRLLPQFVTKLVPAQAAPFSLAVECDREPVEVEGDGRCLLPNLPGVADPCQRPRT